MEANNVKSCINLKTASTNPEAFTLDKVGAPIDTPLNVLVIDDNPVNLAVAARLLQKMGCTVHTAKSGSEGIEKLREQPIKCVFMDCQMPNLSGFETTQLIRQGKAGRDKANVFISALTAYADVENKVLCYESGMNHFIAKPLRKKSFVKALDVLRSDRNPNLTEYHEYSISCLLKSAI
jgi:CheY-like chemotaxis protein